MPISLRSWRHHELAERIQAAGEMPMLIGFEGLGFLGFLGFLRFFRVF